MSKLSRMFFYFQAGNKFVTKLKFRTQRDPKTLFVFLFFAAARYAASRRARRKGQRSRRQKRGARKRARKETKGEGGEGRAGGAHAPHRITLGSRLRGGASPRLSRTSRRPGQHGARPVQPGQPGARWRRPALLLIPPWGPLDTYPQPIPWLSWPFLQEGSYHTPHRFGILLLRSAGGAYSLSGNLAPPQRRAHSRAGRPHCSGFHPGPPDPVLPLRLRLVLAAARCACLLQSRPAPSAAPPSSTRLRGLAGLPIPEASTTGTWQLPYPERHLC